eukprot:3207266-Pyramimonas_sp.AAC.1
MPSSTSKFQSPSPKSTLSAVMRWVATLLPSGKRSKTMYLSCSTARKVSAGGSAPSSPTGGGRGGSMRSEAAESTPRTLALEGMGPETSPQR